MTKQLQSQLRSVLGAAFLMTLATGYTNCDQFSTVTVPSADTDKPDTLSTFYDASTGEHSNLSVNGVPLNTKVPYDKGNIVVTSVIDADGATGLLTRWNLRVRCCSGTGSSKRCDTRLARNVTTQGNQSQEASPGQRVSNGIYDYASFHPRNTLEEACGSRAKTSEFVFAWESYGWGFDSPATAHWDSAYYNAIPPNQ